MTTEPAQAVADLESTQIIGEYNLDDDLPPTKEDDEQIDLLSEENAYLKVSSGYIKELRLIKKELEEFVYKKIRNLEFERTTKTNSRSIYYFKHFSIDKVGNQVIQGETGIAEGWTIPKYENEFQNLLGLPFTEDNALGETLRLKRPHMECFNCLALNHRVNECPIKIDEERIRLHRQMFNTQSQQAQDQAQLFSTRYMAKNGGGEIVPGKLSAQLREALGLRDNQLPSFVYRMREYGYPIGWLLEARVSKSNLAVHDGGGANAVAPTSDLDAEANGQSDQIEYDPEKIFTFVGFNEHPPKGTIDESDKYGVRRYGSSLSRERFLGTLKLHKRKIIRRSTGAANKSTMSLNETTGGGGGGENPEEEVIELDDDDDEKDNSVEEIDPEEGEEEKEEEGVEKETSLSSQKSELEEGEQEASLSGGETNEFESPKKKMKKKDRRSGGGGGGNQSRLGTSLVEIPGTPIMRNITHVDRVPTSDKFSVDICDHKPFEMEGSTPSGSYQKIVDLTRKFKSFLPNSSSSH